MRHAFENPVGKLIQAVLDPGYVHIRVIPIGQRQAGALQVDILTLILQELTEGLQNNAGMHFAKQAVKGIEVSVGKALGENFFVE